MRVVLDCRECIVIDDFLPESDLKKLRRWFEATPMKGGLSKLAWRRYDGPYQSTEFFVEPATNIPSEVKSFLDKIRALPQRFLKRMFRNRINFHCAGFSYPPGSGINWHHDDHVAGIFIFYFHKKWETGWGGDLLIEASEEHRFGHFIEPRPNRLVLFRGDSYHSVRRVEQQAHPNQRLSMSGHSDLLVKGNSWRRVKKLKK